MPKAKSSATSGTRKKHARRAAGDPPEDDQPKNLKEKKTKGKKAEPRPKVYIPPKKPTALRPDPLDTFGISHQLPPDLLVVLRRFTKKDVNTKRRALEELQSDWVIKENNEEVLLLMLPVWVSFGSPLF